MGFQVTAPYLPPYNVYNLTDASMTRFRRAVANARLGTQDVRVLAEGDSITAGSGSSGNTPWISRCTDVLSSIVGGINSRRGLAVVNPADAQWTVGWTSSFGVAPLSDKASAVGSANVATFAPTAQGDSFIVYAYSAAAGSASIQYSLDGGAYTTWTNPASGGWTSFTVSAGSVGVHTLALKAAATGSGSNAVIMGAEIVNSTSRGFRVAWRGSSGITTGGSYLLTASGDGYSGYKALAPDLVAIMLGTNDAATAVAVSTFQSNLTAMVTNAKALTSKPSVVLVAWPPNNVASAAAQIPYYAAMDAVADATNVPVVHIDKRWVDYPTSSTNGYMSDNYHPTDQGHMDIGTAVANILAACA